MPVLRGGDQPRTQRVDRVGRRMSRRTARRRSGPRRQCRNAPIRTVGLVGGPARALSQVGRNGSSCRRAPCRRGCQMPGVRSLGALADVQRADSECPVQRASNRARPLPPPTGGLSRVGVKESVDSRRQDVYECHRSCRRRIPRADKPVNIPNTRHGKDRSRRKDQDAHCCEQASGDSDSFCQPSAEEEAHRHKKD